MQNWVRWQQAKKPAEHCINTSLPYERNCRPDCAGELEKRSQPRNGGAARAYIQFQAPWLPSMALFTKEYTIDASNPLSYGQASSHFKKALKQLGIAPPIIKRTAIAMYEAEINTIIHGGGGTGLVVIEDDHIEIVFEDQGPGIADIEQAMQAGYSTASRKVREMGFGAGLGLPNIQKNASDLKIESTPGKGTKVIIRIAL